MKTLLATSALAMLAAGSVFAGGIDRSGQSVSVIFEEGDYMEFSFGSVDPTVSGVQTFATPFGPAGDGSPSGDMAPSYTRLGMGYKQQLNDNLSFGLIWDQPFGADVAYPGPQANPPYYAAGSTATLSSNALTAVVKYTTDSNFSVYGGARFQNMSAEAMIPFVESYTANADQDSGTGWLVGAAWEKPEIALRVALTYNSEINHTFATSESCVSTVAESALACAADFSSTFTDVTTPESINLEFQSGIAADTLVFGSIRWVNWSDFHISPTLYGLLTEGGSLVSYDNDTVSYSIGVGRRFSDTLSGAISYGYEAAAGGFASNLGPTDGYNSITAGLTYTMDNVSITGGVSYVMIGDAQTTLNDVLASGVFEGNSALGFGIKVGMSF